jgi:hypothetical protein
MLCDKHHDFNMLWVVRVGGIKADTKVGVASEFGGASGSLTFVGTEVVVWLEAN